MQQCVKSQDSHARLDAPTSTVHVTLPRSRNVLGGSALRCRVGGAKIRIVVQLLDRVPLP